MREIIVIAHNLRSTHNVGSLFRTCEGLGIKKLLLTGYTPYPHKDKDNRLPYLSEKISKQIDKTALGATNSLDWEYCEDISEIIEKIKQQGYTLAALEQSPSSHLLHEFTAPEKLALVIGNEVEGVSKEILDEIPIHLEIPMSGSKESFNVVQATAMALYQFVFF